MPTTRTAPKVKWDTLADLLHDLGDIPPERVLLKPTPGKATEEDLLRLLERHKRLCELVDGTLVEKAMGAAQSCLADVLARRLGVYVENNKLGITMGEAGPTRLMIGLTRLPDYSYFSWERMPSRKYPSERVVGVAPNLAVEVISEGNTPAEILRKLKEYFLSGVDLAWVIDPYKRTVAVHTAPDVFVLKTEEETLDGGSLIPGFTLSLKEFFSMLPDDFRRTPRKRKKT